jgi:cytochrome P450
LARLFQEEIASMSVLKRAPGPPGRFLSGNLPEFRRDLLAFFTRCARDYGDVAAFRLGPRPCLLLSHPDAIEDVLVTNARNFTKHFALRMNRLLLANGLLTSEGDFWLRQRRLIQPAFQRDRIATYAPVMVAYTERLLAKWKDGETLDLHTEMMRLTLEIVAKALFDADVANEARDVGVALEVALNSFVRRLFRAFPLPHWVPTPANIRLKRAVRRLDEIVYSMIRDRRSRGDERDDLLSRLLRAQDEDGSRMTDKQLRDEMMTLFLAGHETTAIALSWMWYLLSQHPEAEARLLAELRTVLGDRSPTVADLPRLRYAEGVVTESMRLYPPAYAIGRENIADCEIGGYPVPAGTTLLMSQWVVHRDARWFPEPLAFRPERWEGDLARRIPKYAYFPFGGGPRLCVGNNFALMEAVLILATIAQRFHFDLVPGHPVATAPSMTLRPRYGMRMVLRKR